MDTPSKDPASWLGDGKIDAVAVEVEPNRFRLDVRRVVWTRVASGLEITSWTPDGGIVVARR